MSEQIAKSRRRPMITLGLGLAATGLALQGCNENPNAQREHPPRDSNHSNNSCTYAKFLYGDIVTVVVMNPNTDTRVAADVIDVRLVGSTDHQRQPAAENRASFDVPRTGHVELNVHAIVNDERLLCNSPVRAK